MSFIQTFNQAVSEYGQFNAYVATFKQELANDPSSLLNGGSAAENAIIKIALNGDDSNFSLIEGSSALVSFGKAFYGAITTVLASQVTSTLALSGGGTVAVTDQNGLPITAQSLANGSVTSITFLINRTEEGMHSVWNLPTGLPNLNGAAVTVTKSVQEQGISVPIQESVTLTGPALQQFLAQAQANGTIETGSLDTSPISDVLASFGF